MATMTDHRENSFEVARPTCSGLNLPLEKEQGKKRRAGIFYLPSSVHPWKCDHVFETEDGYQHIVDMTSFAAT